MRFPDLIYIYTLMILYVESFLIKCRIKMLQNNDTRQRRRMVVQSNIHEIINQINEKYRIDVIFSIIYNIRFTVAETDITYTNWSQC